jgi:D-amino peptidase
MVPDRANLEGIPDFHRGCHPELHHPRPEVHAMSATSRFRLLVLTTMSALFVSVGVPANAQERLRIFISVDMEGIGGIGTRSMTSRTGKDYALGRELMTAEVNAVVSAIFEHGPAEVLVNDSHGDMQNLLHTSLDPRVEYIQGNIKPLGMVQGLDGSFDAAVFLGYHARAGTENGFLAHTGSGSVKGLWLNGVEVGEGGLNAHFAGSLEVPVILAAGGKTFTAQFGSLVQTRTVATKEAIGSSVARLRHPDLVLADLRAATLEALEDIGSSTPLHSTSPITIRVRFASTTRATILMAIPGMKRIDGWTVEYEADDMDRAYRMIRLMYKYISW